ncbi:MAG: glycosyltransferase family 39 protein [Candidatus Roizmanbacteria bacterium]|nr:MAG: glycosyltransferase family 39 protein [Candidatus Roizmanbacteria bacterium]
MFFKTFPKGIYAYFTVTLIVLASSFILWLPFILKTDNWFGLRVDKPGMRYVYGQFDGPLYIIPAKTFYELTKIDVPGKGLIVSLPIRPQYFAAHLPLYPVFINLFAQLTGFLQSTVIVNILFTVLLACFFYYLIKSFKLSENPLLLTAVFLFLPRFLVIRSVGAPESMFIFFILLSLFFFEKKRYLLAGIAGGLATMVKIPGILLFIAYFVVLAEQYIRLKKINWRAWGIVFIPVGLLTVFTIYLIQYRDFFAFFHTGGVVPMLFPFSVFNFQAKWVGTAWLEEIIFYFVMYLLAVFYLKDTKYRSFFYFILIFFIATVFVQHRDISRYSLPLWPFAAIAFEKFFTNKKFVLACLIILPAIFFYGWNFLVYNIMPISDWSPFL